MSGELRKRRTSADFRLSFVRCSAPASRSILSSPGALHGILLGALMLTDIQAPKAKAEAKASKLPDAAGLHLYVSSTRHKSWRWKYRFGGKERRLVFGPYPEVTLNKARALRDNARGCCATGAIRVSIESEPSWSREPAVVRHSRRWQRAGTRCRRSVGSRSMPPT